MGGRVLPQGTSLEELIRIVNQLYARIEALETQVKSLSNGAA
jgi:hypothetical protein